jgi:hypothetical protein
LIPRRRRTAAVLNEVLSTLDARPVLIDIGASGAPPEVWEPIAGHAIYVGFDPDRRDLHEISDGRFYKATIVPEAATSDKDAHEEEFYLTRSPHCSSTLKPDAVSLSHYLFSELFAVEKRVTVQATTLDAVIEKLALPQIDWLKADSQGTDLRLFNSLAPDTRSRVLALDIEPGLIDAYLGEDLFVDAHRDLTRNGFWLSNLVVRGDTRLRRSTLKAITEFDPTMRESMIAALVKSSPGWCEARYLRTLESLATRHATGREYVLLWVFAMLDHQHGFALDIAVEYARLFPKDGLSEILKTEPVRRIKQLKALHLLRASVPRKVRRFVRQMIR